MEPLKPLGPLLDQDAQFLQAIIKMTNPKLVVEFGHLFGDSARAMLEVMAKDSVLHSYEISMPPRVKGDPRFFFHQKSQTDFEPLKNIDFVFLDASHECTLNIETFKKLVDCMSEKGIIAVHDTGTWPWNIYNFNRGATLSNGRYAHCPEEIEFVNWLQDNYPEWHQIHFHGDGDDVRHGITLLQKKITLEI